MVRVVLVAVPGAGKSTILKKLLEKVPGLRVVNFGDYMFEEAKKSLGISDRDEMRKKVKPTDYKILQERAAEEIAKLEGDLIIDTHAAIKTPYGYYPGMPSKVVETLNPDAIVVLEFRPEDILQRRLKDLRAAEGQRRIREVEAEEEVQEHQDVMREFAAAAANHICCYLLRLKFLQPQKYPYQHAEEAASALADLVKKLKGMG
ncbi:MAG: adenylate kinase [Thaumarchaeota archaeon]|nr:MAG: adenylate kinase [Nitrososphaerota archaeon]HDD42963.1 adenylate kinase [Nitrososphaeria archaeon]